MKPGERSRVILRYDLTLQGHPASFKLGLRIPCFSGLEQQSRALRVILIDAVSLEVSFGEIVLRVRVAVIRTPAQRSNFLRDLSLAGPHVIENDGGAHQHNKADSTYHDLSQSAGPDLRHRTYRDLRHGRYRDFRHGTRNDLRHGTRYDLLQISGQDLPQIPCDDLPQVT
ncbi:MAG TPA: hypothetical protein VMD29_09760 [Terracidiphilus sp.]|nr:hypothetical protein [Terracidiphilus sp.]